MYETQLEISQKQAELPVSPDTRVTQAHGSMEGKKILERIEELHAEEERNNAVKAELNVPAGSKEYYKKSYEAQLEISQKQAELPVSPEDLGI